MRKTLMASAAAVGLVIGMAGAAHGQANPNQDKHPGNERVEKNTPAENAGQRRADEMKPGQNLAAEKRGEEQRAGQADAAQNRAAEQRAGQAEATQKRAEEQRAGQADAAQKRAEERRTNQAEATDKRAEERRVNQTNAMENRRDEQRLNAERRDLNGDRKEINSDRKDLKADRRDVNSDRKDLNAERRDVNAERRDVNADRARDARSHANAVRVEGRIRTSEERADRISAELIRRAHRADVNVAINVGARLPESVVIEPLPADIVEIAPEYRGYDYVYVNDQIVFVEPSSHEVVGMIDMGDNAVAQSEPSLSRARPCPTED